jgi:hypothetical protein
MLSSLGRRYGVTIVTGGQQYPVVLTRGTIDGSDPDESSVREYARVLVPEFSRYPVSLTRRTGLRRIVLAGSLSYGGQSRSAIPDFRNRALFLRTTAPLSRAGYPRPEDEAYQRRVLHHEFFHIVDHFDDGRLFSDPRWSRLNPPDFKYSGGGATAQDITHAASAETGMPGFVTRYSTTGVEEDKAELFSYALTEPEVLKKRTSLDSIVARKVQRLAWLLRRFDPATERLFGRALNEPGHQLTPFRDAGVCKMGERYSCPLLEDARSHRSDVLLYFTRAGGTGGGKRAQSEDESASAFEHILTSDTVLAVAQCMLCLRFTLSEPEQATFAAQLGVHRAPLLMVWERDAPSPIVVSQTHTSMQLAKALTMCVAGRGER